MVLAAILLWVPLGRCPVEGSFQPRQAAPASHFEKLIRPDRLPMFSFLNMFSFEREPNFWPLQRGFSSQTAQYFPGWQYAFKTLGTDVAHQLKKSLTKKAGWALTFPDMKCFWKANAVHKTHGIPDWHIEMMGGNSLPCMDIYDESRDITSLNRKR